MISLGLGVDIFINVILYIFCFNRYKKFLNILFNISNFVVSYIPYLIYTFLNFEEILIENFPQNGILIYPLINAVYILITNEILKKINIDFSNLLKTFSSKIVYLLIITIYFFVYYMYQKYGISGLVSFDLKNIAKINFVFFESFISTLISYLLPGLIFVVGVDKKYNLFLKFLLITLLLIPITFLEFNIIGTRRTILSCLLAIFSFIIIQQKVNKSSTNYIKILPLFIIIFIFISLFQQIRYNINSVAFYETQDISVLTRDNERSTFFNRTTVYDAGIQLTNRLFNKFDFGFGELTMASLSDVLPFSQRSLNVDNYLSDKYSIKNNYIQNYYTTDLSINPILVFLADFGIFFFIIYSLVLSIILKFSTHIFKVSNNPILKLMVLSIFINLACMTEVGGSFYFLLIRLLAFIYIINLILNIFHGKKSITHSR